MSAYCSFVKSQILICLVLCLVSCKTSPNETFSITSLDTSIIATKISISDLARNYKFFHGRYIETTGYFYQSFEEFAIYTKKLPTFGQVDGFWLGTDEGLNIDYVSFEKMNGKLITIKGKIDTTKKGHLSLYIATINKIYFWEQ